MHIGPDEFSKVMPDKKERDLWWKFLAGLPEPEWNPPKKPKKPSSKSRFSGHMRAFCDDPEVAHDTNDDQFHNEIHETWRINSEGDVELAEDESANTLRSVVQLPRITPVSPASTMMTASGMNPPSNHLGPDQPCNPREITPMLLRKIDHVRMRRFSHQIIAELMHRTCPFTFSCISLTG